MNSPRIRHLVQPTMSVDDRNLTVTNEVRTIMTTAAIPRHTSRQRGLELLVSRLAVSMLRWSQHRTNQRRMTHEQMMLICQLRRDSSQAFDPISLRRQF